MSRAQWKCCRGNASLAACKLMVYLLEYNQGSSGKGTRFSRSSFDLHLDLAIQIGLVTGSPGDPLLDILCSHVMDRPIVW